MAREVDFLDDTNNQKGNGIVDSSSNILYHGGILCSGTKAGVSLWIA
jgi:hypothetical protein